MKKLVVLMALLVAAGMLWAQAAAAPAAPVFTMGMVVDYFGAYDFGEGKQFSDRPNYELRFSWRLDDFSTAYIEFEEGPLSTWGRTTGLTTTQGGFGRSGKWLANADRGHAGTLASAGLDRAWITTDLAKALKLPMPVTVMYGLSEWNNRDWIKVTKSEYEDFLGEADIRTWGAQVEVTPSKEVTLRANWAWNLGATNWGTVPADALMPVSWVTDVKTNYPLYLVGAYGTVPPIRYEITYFSNNNEMGKGWIEGGLQFVQDVTKDINLAACFSFEYDMQSDPYPAYGWGGYKYTAQAVYDTTKPSAAPNAAYMLQAGLQLTFQKDYAFGFSWRGAEDMLAGAVQLQAYAKPSKDQPIELMAQLGLGLDSDVFDQSFDSFEVALRYTMGRVIWLVGFYYQHEFGRGVAKEWADFDLAGVYPGGTFNQAPFGTTEALRDAASAIFFRGRVAL